MKIVNQTKRTTLAREAEVADSPLTRIKGLLGRKSLPQGHALVLEPCNSVHTFFMQFSIDVVFVDKKNTVVHCIADMKPGGASPLVLKAHSVIELPAGTIAATSTAPGDTLEYE